jgi:hypothetical protein
MIESVWSRVQVRARAVVVAWRVVEEGGCQWDVFTFEVTRMDLYKQAVWGH